MSVKAREAVQTAALLGKSGRHELALELLDVVVEHSEDEDIRAAVQVDRFALVPELRRDPLRVEIGTVGIVQNHWKK